MGKFLYGFQQVIQLKAYSVKGIRHLWIQRSNGGSALGTTYNANTAVKAADGCFFNNK